MELEFWVKIVRLLLLYLNQTLVPLSMPSPSNQSKKRSISEVESVDMQSSRKENIEENEVEDFYMRYTICRKNLNIPSALAFLLSLIDRQGRHVDE